MRRAAETEKGQMKSAQARSHSANMINSALQRYPVSEDVGQILTGAPGTTAPKLVILKFGIDSDEWQQMTATTISLLDSLQPGAEEEQDGRRQTTVRKHRRNSAAGETLAANPAARRPGPGNR